MVFVDVHAHIDFYDDYKIHEIIKRAREANIGIIIANGVNPPSNKKVISLAEIYPEIKVSLGMYPSDAVKLAHEDFEKGIEFIKENKNKIIALGEIGLDLKELDDLGEQKKIFVEMIDIAKQFYKPVIVHSRKAEKHAVEILEQKNMKRVVMHCFHGNFKLVNRIIKNNWFFSVPAIVKNSEHFQKIVEITPIENLLCETDSPFLHPDKKRNNEPCNIIESYKKISEIKNLSLKDVENKIYENYKRVFEAR